MDLVRELYDVASEPDDAHVQSKRSEVRPVTQPEPLDLEIGGECYPSIAVARDVGTDTMGITSKIPIEEHSRIRVRLALTEGQWSEASVIRCTEAIGGYQIGLKIV
ncbi:MAG: hypothetical protein ACYTF1_17330 [Planctomycetota bacterium]|jgi:hypothetical protein